MEIENEGAFRSQLDKVVRECLSVGVTLSWSIPDGRVAWGRGRGKVREECSSPRNSMCKGPEVSV